LTHVVFATAIDNPYHEPPHWLNEGLAVYLSDGYDAAYKARVESAARDGSIIPLDGLAGAFPTTRDRFFLAYGESVSAVDRIVRVNGRPSLVKLIRSYRDGVSDDEAFNAALGRDLAGFESDWLAELGAKPPVRRGPQPAPGGPVPAGWAGPQPNASFDVIGSAAPTASAPTPIGNGQTSALFAVIIAIAAAAALIVLVAAVVLRRRREAATARFRLLAAAPPSTVWTTTDWSLPRDVDPPGDSELTVTWDEHPSAVQVELPIDRAIEAPSESTTEPPRRPPNEPPAAP
jgi:hypothetical protein